MAHGKTIVWFRQDIRIQDNPALQKAVSANHEILPVFIHDTHNAGNWDLGAASKVWLHHALKDLNKQLNDNLLCLSGNPQGILQDLIKQYDIQNVYWNRCYEPWRIKRDTQIKDQLTAQDITVESFNGSLLWEPWTVKKQDGTPYKVFTPFFKKGCLGLPEPREPATLNDQIRTIEVKDKAPIDALEFLPTKPRWDNTMVEHWDISESGAHETLETFLDNGLQSYKKGRDFPAEESVSRLSPYLHFGQISPHEVYHTSKMHAFTHDKQDNWNHFCSELGWREFSYSLLYHNPEMPERNIKEQFDKMPWREDDKALSKWQKGMTGYPIIDAGMRELWQTGYMHNRVRMIVASFVIKNLLIDWREGEKWFWDTLFDADLANNSASWQWVAGSGADAAPYFRIFNPVTQSKKFDPTGEYIRRYVPELQTVGDAYIHEPWEYPGNIDYPKPMVDLSSTRQRALDALKVTKD